MDKVVINYSGGTKLMVPRFYLIMTWVLYSSQ